MISITSSMALRIDSGCAGWAGRGGGGGGRCSRARAGSGLRDSSRGSAGWSGTSTSGDEVKYFSSSPPPASAAAGSAVWLATSEPSGGTSANSGDSASSSSGTGADASTGTAGPGGWSGRGPRGPREPRPRPRPPRERPRRRLGGGELCDDAAEGVGSGSDIMFSGGRLTGIGANANKTQRRTAQRSLAEDERGLARTSSAPGRTTSSAIRA